MIHTTTSGWPEFFLTLQDHSIFENISENIETKSLTLVQCVDCGRTNDQI